MRSSKTFSTAPSLSANEHTRVIDTKEEFYDFFTPKNPAKPEIHGGFALAHWNGSREVEEQIKNDLKVTIRCIPFDDPANPPSAGNASSPASQAHAASSGRSLISLLGPAGSAESNVSPVELTNELGGMSKHQNLRISEEVL